MKMLGYLVQVAACTGVFYVFYHFVLARFTFFTLNRWYLLGTLLASFVIPLVTIPVFSKEFDVPLKVIQFSAVEQAYQNPVSVISRSVGEAASTNWNAIILTFYLIGALSFLFFLVASMFSFYKRISLQQYTREDNIKIFQCYGNQRNGSFLNCVFVNKAGLSQVEFEQIVAHEKIHVQRRHSFDIVVARIISVVLWFNPFAHIYLNAIHANHEYEVDQKVTLKTDKAGYAALILRLATNKTDLGLKSYFSTHPLHKRMEMLFSTPTRSLKRTVYLLLPFLIAVNAICFANRKATKTEVFDAVQGVKISPYANNENRKQEKKKKLKVVEDNILSPVVSKEVSVAVSQEADNLRNAPRLSVIDGTKYHGRNPLVFIDNIEYPSEILEKLSSKGIRGTSWLHREYAIEKYGERAKDGVVNIKTKNGEIAYLTEIERENLVMINTVKPGEFFRRITLKDENGNSASRDYVSVHRPDGREMMSADISRNGKAAFVLNGEIYNEVQILKIDRSLIKSSGGHGLGSPEHFPDFEERLQGYELVFFIPLENVRIITSKQVPEN